MGKIAKAHRQGISTTSCTPTSKAKCKSGLRRKFSVTNSSAVDVSIRPSNRSQLKRRVREKDESDDSDVTSDLLAKRLRAVFKKTEEKQSSQYTTPSHDEEIEDGEESFKSCSTGSSSPISVNSSTPPSFSTYSGTSSKPNQPGVKMFNHHGIMYIVLSDFASAAFGGAGFLLILQGSIGLQGVKVSASENLVLPVESVPGSCILLTNRGYDGQVGNITESLDRIGATRSLNKAKELLQRYPKKTVIAIQGRPDNYSNLKPNFSAADDSTPENSWESLGFYVIPTLSAGLVYNRRFDDLVNTISKTSAREPVRVVLAGSKDSGKSSMIRALCNRFLLERIRNEHQDGDQAACPILVLDLDPGQTEFTPPGCVSLVEVTETLMGPPSSHPIKPEKSFLVAGGPTPGAHPDMYVRSVELLMQFLHENSSGSYILLVNTMGWLNGIGELLFGSVLNIVEPNKIVSLDAELKIPSSAWFCREICTLPPVTHIPQLQAMYYKDPFTKAVKAALHREASIIGYFKGSSIMEKHPYPIPWFKVALHEASGVAPCQEIFYLMNGSMVALCRAPERIIIKSKSKPLFPKFIQSNRKGPEEPLDCLGFGIVRCIDPINRWIYIATPESPEIFETVNALIYNSISLPAYFYVNQRSEIAPYVRRDKLDLDCKRMASPLVNAENHS